MAKYEVMLLVSGKISPEQATSITDQLKQNIKTESIETKYLGIKNLAYQIKKESTAHYFLLNFNGDAKSTFDFNRLTLINKSVLRHLIINLEKDYGWRAVNNEKKVRLAKHRLVKYEEIMANPDAPRPLPRKARYERPKRRDEWDIVLRVTDSGIEEPLKRTPTIKRKGIESRKPDTLEPQGE